MPGRVQVTQGARHRLALGALIAAAVPPSRREDEMLGEASDRMTDQLRHKAEEGYQKASAKGEEVANRVKHEVSNSDSNRSTGSTSSTGSTGTTGSTSTGI